MAWTIIKDEIQQSVYDSAAALKVRKECEWTYILGMCGTFSAASFAWMPFAIPFETNEPYAWIACGFLASMTIAAASANRLLTIISQTQDRENHAWKAVRSYDRQLNEANSRAAEANRLADRRRRIEGAADGDNGEIKCSPSAWRIN